MVTPLPRPTLPKWQGMLGRQGFAPAPLPGSRPRALPSLPSMDPFEAIKAFASRKSSGPPAEGLLGSVFGLGDNAIYKGIKNSHVLDSLSYGLLTGTDWGDAMSKAGQFGAQMRPTWRAERKEDEADWKKGEQSKEFAARLREWGPEFDEYAEGLESGSLDFNDVWGPAVQRKGQLDQQMKDDAQSRKYGFFIRDPELRAQVERGEVNYKVALDYEKSQGGQYRPLTTEEAGSYGLDSPDGYQVNGEGNIDKIGGSGTTVNMPAGENAYDKALGEGNAKRALEIQDGALKGTRALTTLGMMENAISDPSFYSGTLANEAVLPLKRAAAALGIDPSGVTSMESFNALSKQSALDIMGGSLGTGFSNADRDFVIDQVPNLGNSPEGNAQLIEIQKALAQRQIEISQLADMYAEENGGRVDAGFYQFIAQWAEQNPLFVGEGGPGAGPGGSGGAPTLPDPFGVR